MAGVATAARLTPTGERAAEPVVDAEHPWLGLYPFTEATQAYFFGRSAEIRDIYLRVREHPLTVLYGQSGLGKTSLLGAGLMPKLRVERYRPVRVLLDFAPGAPSYAAQARAALAQACADSAEEAAAWLARWEGLDTLWEIVTHEALRPADLAERPPVLLIDQFEEVFALGEAEASTSGAHRERVAELFTALGDLVEHRPPAALQERFQSQPELALAYDFGPLPVRVVLTLREDYLAPLEQWKGLLPSLMRNRMGLRLLSGPQALEAVVRPGRAGGRELVSEAVGARIVCFVAERPVDTPLAEIEAVPPLVSLLCERLNAARLATDPAGETITGALVDTQGADILQRFYDESFVEFPEAEREAIRAWVEDDLVSVRGKRNPVAREDAAAALAGSGVAAADIVLDALVARRLLTVEQRGGTQRLELTHDVLAPLVVRARDERRERQAREAAEKRQREAEAQAAIESRRLRQTRWAMAAFAVLFLAAMVSAVYAWQQTRRAQARQLAAQALAAALREDAPAPDVGLVLAVQGVRIEDAPETREALRQVLGRHIQPRGVQGDVAAWRALACRILGPDLGAVIERAGGVAGTAVDASACAAGSEGPGPALEAPPGMVLVPAGCFWMGCNDEKDLVDGIDQDCEADEKPGRYRCLDTFAMDRTEVTVEQFRQCVAEGACSAEGLTMPAWSDYLGGPMEERPEVARFCNWDVAGREQHPINCVDWEQARAYCERAGKQRLPTEAEWEKAGRGTDGRKYPWGNRGFAADGPRVANIADESAKQEFPGWTIAEGYDDGYVGTAPVEEFEAGASPYGALNMAGNVWEWVEDNYPGLAARVVRGGCWSGQPQGARASRRLGSDPRDRDGRIGFRCAQ